MPLGNPRQREAVDCINTTTHAASLLLVGVFVYLTNLNTQSTSRKLLVEDRLEDVQWRLLLWYLLFHAFTFREEIQQIFVSLCLTKNIFDRCQILPLQIDSWTRFSKITCLFSLEFTQ